MKKWKWIIVVLGSITAVMAYFGYTMIYGSNVPTKLEKSTLNLPQGTNFDALTDSLLYNGIIEDVSSFRLVSKLMKFDTRSNITGRFEIEPGWSNRELITLLRANRQAPINVTINNVRLISDMAGKVARYIEPDSLTLLNYLTDSTNLKKWGYTPETILTLFVPNTYQFYWNTSPAKFVERMQKEHDKYWNSKGRKEAAATLNMTPKDAYILASIIEKETTNAKEVKTISGVYQNRLDHDYIFFCAKPGYDNEHSFASSLSQHNRNAKIYHNWLNKEGIKK